MMHPSPSFKADRLERVKRGVRRETEGKDWRNEEEEEKNKASRDSSLPAPTAERPRSHFDTSLPLLDAYSV